MGEWRNLMKEFPVMERRGLFLQLIKLKFRPLVLLHYW